VVDIEETVLRHQNIFNHENMIILTNHQIYCQGEFGIRGKLLLIIWNFNLQFV
jgi:hypothetical protein